MFPGIIFAALRVKYMSKNKQTLLIAVFVLIFSNSRAQLKYYAQPLKIPVSISGNFGELRPDHFHTGIDFRTEQRTGVPVYSTAEGYISRIVVSPGGYGHALYISHTNGTSSLYGHLLRFRTDIEQYVKEEQYRRQSFSVDLEIPGEKFVVKRQELIAFSGNSGSSAGPHLHFELRDAPAGEALNPQLYDSYGIADKKPPGISSVEFCPIGDGSHIEFSHAKKTYKTVLNGKTYTLSVPSVIKACGRVAVAFSADDYVDNSTSRCAIYSSRLDINGTQVFSWKIDCIPFNKNRYLNSHIDYESYEANRTLYHKMWRDRGNELEIYDSDEKRGIFRIDSGRVYLGELTLSDVNGNTSRLSFEIMGVSGALLPDEARNGVLFSLDSVNHFTAPDFEISTPSGAFYEDLYFGYRKTERLPGYFSGIHTIGDAKFPVHKTMQIRIKTEGLPDSLADKAFIAEVDGLSLKRYAGGTLKEGWMEAGIMNFGNYAVVTDTIPPVIVPLTIKNNALTDPGVIRFRITDDLSGIKRYNGKIDGQWALFEYDPKYARLACTIDTTRTGTGKRHSLELEVSDMAGNLTIYRATFWK